MTANATALAGATTETCTNIDATDVTNDYDGTPPAEECVDNFGLATGELVTFTITDDCGRTTTCQARIKIIDSTAPVTDCSVISDLELECDQDYATEISNWLTANAAALAGATTETCTNIDATDVTNDYDGTPPAEECVDNFVKSEDIATSMVMYLRRRRGRVV